LNPAPVGELSQLLRRFKEVLTVEAHYRVGGVGSLTAEIIAEEGVACRLVRCGVDSATDGISGSEEFMNRKYGLSCEQLVATALRVLQK
jgi:transketolase